MNKTAISLFIWSLLLILAQAVVFNHVCLFGYAIPLVFLYTIIKLPITLSKEWLFTIAFAIGMTVDIFSDTLGMNALASTITMAVRRPVIRLYVARDEDLSNPYPGLKSFGTFAFIKYTLTVTLIYSTIIFTIESFSLMDISRTTMKILASTILTTLLILGIDSLNVRKSEKRL